MGEKGKDLLLFAMRGAHAGWGQLTFLPSVKSAKHSLLGQRVSREKTVLPLDCSSTTVSQSEAAESFPVSVSCMGIS